MDTFFPNKAHFYLPIILLLPPFLKAQEVIYDDFPTLVMLCGWSNGPFTSYPSTTLLLLYIPPFLIPYSPLPNVSEHTGSGSSQQYANYHLLTYFLSLLCFYLFYFLQGRAVPRPEPACLS